MSNADKVILAACVGVLAFYFLNMTKRPLPADQPGVEQVVVEDGDPAAKPADEPNGTEPTKTAPVATTEPAESTIPEAFVDLPEAEPIDLVTEEMVATIDPNLGGITKIVLSNHIKDDNSGPVEIANGNTPYLSVFADKGITFSKPQVTTNDDTGVTVTRAVVGEPLVLIQSWQLSDKDPHALDYTVRLENRGPTRTAIPPFMLDLGSMEPLSQATGFMGAGGIDQRVDVCPIDDEPDWYANNEIKKFDDDEKQEIAVAPTDWVAVQNKYFALITDLDQAFNGVTMRVIPEKVDVNGKMERPELVTGTVAMLGDPIAPAGHQTWTYSIYTGPKSWDSLKALGNQKQKLMQMDLFMIFHLDLMQWVSLAIRWMILFVHGLCGNYGIAIICATIVIRMAFWPITHRSTMMSRKMQALQPIVKELNEKYKDDPQKKSLKMMEVYKENNVNLAAGCLPVLLQIPVFFALFNVLRSSIELRHQPFFGWVTDLSAPDTVGPLIFNTLPINPLAAVWGATMILQQRCMPQSADPMQQRMMMIMTAGMLVFMYNMPSGLVLYWTVSNLISILQYRVTRVKSDDDKKSPPAGAKQPAAA